MTMMILADIFGIAIAQLFAGIAQVESECGMTSTNTYQLTTRYVDDVNRIQKLKPTGGTAGCEMFQYSDVYNRDSAERMMLVYWTYYGDRYRRITGKQPTAEVLARIHNGGPSGWKRHATDGYWRKVSLKLENAKGEGKDE